MTSVSKYAIVGEAHLKGRSRIQAGDFEVVGDVLGGHHRRTHQRPIHQDLHLGIGP